MATRPRKLNSHGYSLGEEIANAVSHGVGALLAIAALVLLIVKAAFDGAGLRLVAALCMGISYVLEFSFSTLYHALVPPVAKRVFQVLDHSAIYLLIAGSYAPFALVTLEPVGGVHFYLIIVALALVGVLLEVISPKRNLKWISVLLYLGLGWMIVLQFNNIVALLAPPAFWLLLAGGICYSVGTLFYMAKRVPYLHFVWHLWVLAGAVLIFLSAVLFVI